MVPAIRRVGHETFGGTLKAVDPRPKPAKPKKPEPRNFLTNPGKKGGFGTTDTTFGRLPPIMHDYVIFQTLPVRTQRRLPHRLSQHNCTLPPMHAGKITYASSAYGSERDANRKAFAAARAKQRGTAFKVSTNGQTGLFEPNPFKTDGSRLTLKPPPTRYLRDSLASPNLSFC